MGFLGKDDGGLGDVGDDGDDGELQELVGLVLELVFGLVPKR